MMSNDSTIIVETKNNKMNKMTKLHSIQLKFILQYIPLTNYYIVEDTIRSWIMTAHKMWKQKTIELRKWQNCI